MSTPFHLLVPRAILEAMVAQARAALPNECCGLLAGLPQTEGDGRIVGRVSQCYPLINVAEEPTRRYRADDKGLFTATRAIREGGQKELAIYHSHPTSAPVPSQTDLAMAFWPGVVSLILSLESAEPQIRGWWLTETEYHEAQWEVVE